MENGVTQLLNMLNKTIYEFDGFGFKFGMYAGHIIEREFKTSVFGLVRRMNEDGQQTTALLQYFFAGAQAYEDFKKTGKNLTLDEVAEFLEVIGETKAVEIFNESLALPKNSEAPKETGQS